MLGDSTFAKQSRRDVPLRVSQVSSLQDFADYVHCSASDG